MITIQKATLKDAQKISYLIQQNTKNNPNKYTEEQIEAWRKYNTPSKIKNQFSEREVYCAFKQHKLVGTIALKTNEIVGFYVSYSQRGKGIGLLLFNFIQNIIIKNGHQQIQLTSTPSALEFYKKNGFLVVKNIRVTIDEVNYEEFTMYKNLN